MISFLTQIFDQMRNQTLAAFTADVSSFLDKTAAVFDFCRLGIHTGSRLGEYGQGLATHDSSKFAQVPKFPDACEWAGTPLAFMASDFTFYDASQVLIWHLSGC